MSLLADVLAGRAPGPAFAPWLWELAADRAGLGLDEMRSSATGLVAALRDAAELVESDTITVLVDPAGGEELEVLRRLAALGAGRDVVAVIPGPTALAGRLGLDDPDDRDEAAEDLARAVLETRPDVLVLAEPEAGADTGLCLRTIGRMAAHYGVRTMVIGPAVDGFDAAVPVTGTEEGPVVTTSWVARPAGADADGLRAQARRIRRRRQEEAAACR